MVLAATATVVIVAAAGCGGGSSGTSSSGGSATHRHAKQAKQQAKQTVTQTPKAKQPKPKPPAPKPKPKPINTEDQACSGYSGPDANACHDSYEYACVNAQVKQQVQAYCAGNAPDLSTIAKRWAIGNYTHQGSWQAGMAGCLAALMDEYHRLYGGG